MKTKVELIITSTASVALFFPFFFMSHPINHIVGIGLFVRVWVLWDAALSKKKQPKTLQELCARPRVFCFVCVSHWKEAQLQCGATLALIKHPCQSIGLIRCFVFFFPQTLK